MEDRGIPPDYEVNLDPAAARQGLDHQLKKAVEVVVRLLKERPMAQHKRPPYPNYHRHDGLGVSTSVSTKNAVEGPRACAGRGALLDEGTTGAISSPSSRPRLTEPRGRRISLAI